MKSAVRPLAVLIVAALVSFLSAESARAQSITCTGGYYQNASEIVWYGTYYIPPGITTFHIEAYYRATTWQDWRTSSDLSDNYPNWLAWSVTDPEAAGTYVGARLWYHSGGEWHYVDSNIVYLDSPYN